MLFSAELNFSLPLQNPVLIFSLILFIILFAPLILNKLKIPPLIGLIIAGAVIGPAGLNLMLRDSSIVLFGTVGLLYIMFLAGLEIDMAEFKKNSGKSLVFGLYTFIIPMVMGTAAGLYVLNFRLDTSILMASMFASHTLIAYPLVSKIGVAKNRAVNITVGGTVITDTLALLVLAVIVGMSVGEVTNEFWWRLSISIVVFGAIVMLLFPIIGRWFFKRFSDSVSQYIFVLAMVFLGAFLAEAAGIEGIIGAFLAGLALNRLIPHTSALMNRIEFVGNAIFIPLFLIGVGMLIDYRAFIKDLDTIKVAAVMTFIATLAKFIAAWLTQKTFKFNKNELRLIFGLSNAQAAATLAAVLVGYKIILNQAEITAGAEIGIYVEPVRLLGDSILNGTILMILVTCTVASFVAQRGAQALAIEESKDNTSEDKDDDEKILMPVNDLSLVDEQINFGIIIKSKKNKRGLFALNIVAQSEADDRAAKNAKKILEKAAVAGAATDNNIRDLMRYDLNIVNGITNVIKEHIITDLVLAVNKEKSMSANFLSNLNDGILARTNVTTLIYRPSQPLATIKRHIVIVPEKAEREIGFGFWLIKIWNIARNSGAKIIFYAPHPTLQIIKEVHAKHPIETEFKEFSDWDDFLILSRDINKDDDMFIVMSRRNRPSYHAKMERIPMFLNKYFNQNNFILVYPIQTGVDGSSLDLKNASILEPMERLDEIGKTLTGLFKRK